MTVPVMTHVQTQVINTQENLEFYSDLHTDKKEKKIFLIYKEIQMVSGANPYMANGLLLYG
jgi:hypothetical protein